MWHDLCLLSYITYFSHLAILNNIFVIGTTEGEDAKSRKRRRSSLSFLEQWMWGGKRRSARVRSTVKREAEREDGNLQEALRRLVPQSLL
jgi:hypothetical protein